MHQEVPAPREIATWVSASWRETVTVGSHADGVHPDGSIDIVWDGSELTVLGPRTRSGAAHRLRTGTFVGVRLRPGSTRAMLGESAIALADRTTPLESLWGSGAREAKLRLEASAPEHAMAAFGSVIGDRARSLTRRVDPLIPSVVELAGSGRTVREIADDVGLSERQLYRRIVDEVGYGPKHLVRVLRLQRLLTLARRLPGASLARLATTAGYADQPHMSRDCHALTGVTPGRLVYSQRHPSR